MDHNIWARSRQEGARIAGNRRADRSPKADDIAQIAINLRGIALDSADDLQPALRCGEASNRAARRTKPIVNDPNRM
jgi:hypothetical protein